MTQLFARWRQSHLYALFNFSDELAKGRCCAALHSALFSMITWLTTGLFYTSFLMANDINLVNINILAFVPFIAGCFAIVSPMLLERLPRRKQFLACGKLLSYTLNLLGITILPVFVHDPQSKVACFVALVFLSGVLDNLTNGGFSAWHLKFMPEEVRADFLAINTFITNLLGLSAALLSGVIADSLNGSPYETAIITAFRYTAFVLGVIDVLVLIVPREYPYEHSAEQPRVRDIFVLPLQNRKFMLTVGIVFLWTFFLNAPAATLNYYLLNDVHVSYSFINIINIFYPLFLLLFSPFWKIVLHRAGWWKTFAVAAMLHTPTTIMYSCVTAGNSLWLLPTLRLIQHFLGVGMNIAYANLIYINLPVSDQTNYISFYNLIVNVAAFLGTMAGTWFSAAFPDICITVFGFPFCNAQILQWVQAFGQFAVPLLVLLGLKHLQPDDPARRFG